MDEKSNGKEPAYVAYHVKEGSKGQSYFNKIGAAFEHKDGQGYNVVLDATPVNGRVTLRSAKERLNEMKEHGTKAVDREIER